MLAAVRFDTSFSEEDVHTAITELCTPIGTTVLRVGCPSSEAPRWAQGAAALAVVQTSLPTGRMVGKCTVHAVSGRALRSFLQATVVDPEGTTAEMLAVVLDKVTALLKVAAASQQLAALRPKAPVTVLCLIAPPVLEAYRAYRALCAAATEAVASGAAAPSSGPVRPVASGKYQGLQVAAVDFGVPVQALEAVIATLPIAIVLQCNDQVLSMANLVLHDTDDADAFWAERVVSCGEASQLRSAVQQEPGLQALHARIDAQK